MLYLTYINTQAVQLDANKIIEFLYGQRPTYAAIEHQEYSKNYTARRTIKQDRLTMGDEKLNVLHNMTVDMSARCRTFIESKQGDLQSCYSKFYIPKHSGGLREINAPNDDIAELQRDIVDLFQNKFKLLEHNNAFAYVQGRSTKDALIRHKNEKARWFLKLDIKDFFPNCTESFILRQFRQIFPLHLIPEYVLEPIIQVCMLNGGLPQGAPSSPFLTNIIMIPFDYEINKLLYDYNKSHYCVTRYADDILITNKFNFDFKEIEAVVNKCFLDLQMPFQIKESKTRYGSSSGRNWNLGLMYNKEGDITVGHRRKKRVKNALYAIFNENIPTVTWNWQQAQSIIGEVSYVQQIEPGSLDNHISKLEERYQIRWSDLRKKVISNY